MSTSGADVKVDPAKTETVKSEAPDAAALAKQLAETSAMLELLKKQNGDYAAAEKARADKAAADKALADKAAADKLQADKDAASKGGDLAKVLEIERAQAADAAKKVSELAPQASRAAKLEAAIRAEVADVEAKLTPEQLAAVKHIEDPADRLPILKVIAGMKPAAAVPAAAIKVGQPGAAGQTFDRARWEAKTPDERRAELATMNPEQMAANFGLTQPRGAFGA